MMDSGVEKDLKEQINEVLQLNNDGDTVEEKVGKIEDIYKKTEAMKVLVQERKQQIEDQFKDLKQKLSESNEYLLKMKKSIENLKFAYKKNVAELNLPPGTCLEANTEYTRENVTKKMEEIRSKIEQLQSKMTEHREKQLEVSESYQQAFDRVRETFEDLEECGDGGGGGDENNAGFTEQ